VPLTSKLLEALREYWRWKKPRVYLFPSKMSDPGVEQPISDKTVWNVCRAAATRAAFRRSSARIPSGIASPHPCWRPEPICAPSLADGP